MLTGLAVWGIYGLVTVTTSPSLSGLVSQILKQVSMTYYSNASGFSIPPGSTAYLAMEFHTTLPSNASQFPPTRAFSGRQGEIWGPFLPSDPDSTVSSFVKHYAVFAWSIVFNGSYAWGLTGPDSSNNPPTYVLSSLIYSTGPGSPTSDTGIMESDTPGNYTLYIDNGGPGKAAVHVTMGYSTVSFAPSRPNFYYGIASLALVAAYSLARLISLPRSPRKEAPPGLRPVQQPLPHDIPVD